MSDQTTDLLYDIARHLANPDDMSIHKWALKGAYLLGKLEKVDPARYKQAMKPTEAMGDK